MVGVLAVVLLYVVLYAFKLARLERDVAALPLMSCEQGEDAGEVDVVDESIPDAGASVFGPKVRDVSAGRPWVL